MDGVTLGSSQRQFQIARRTAYLAALLDIVRRRPSAMPSLADVRTCLTIRGQRSLGLRVVPVQQIVGSEGRYRDFDRRFLPRAAYLQHRWSNVAQAMAQGIDLPPVDLYKIGDIYFVRDGNHRVSVARQQEQVDIDAYVTELIVDVPLPADLSVRDLRLIGEYSDFLEWTNLHILRPDQRIELREPGSYLDLVRQINAHRSALSQAQDRTISPDKAVASWYDTMYLPTVQAIRAQGLLKRFPRHTEAELYCRIMEHHHTGSAADGGYEGAVRAYHKAYRRMNWIRAISAVVQGTVHSGR
jgi:hypothetical protein